MEQRISIKLLGGFDVVVDGRSVGEALSKTKKGQSLLQYLLLHRNAATTNRKLCEALWPDDQGSGNPENALKTLVSRVRALLNACDERLGACIITEHNAYRWSDVPGVEVDLIRFEKLCAELRQEAELTIAVRRKFDEAIALYTGDLLPGAAREEWVVSCSARLHGDFLALAHRYVDMLRAKEAYDAVAGVCRSALNLDAFDEQLHVALMDALVRTNRNNEALLQYRHVTSLHARYLDSQVPEGIRNFYSEIVRNGQTLDADIDLIAQELEARPPAESAFVCDYAVFKEYYHLQLRALERSGAVVFLVLIMIGGMDYQPVDPLLLEEVMKDLLGVLQGNLRKGDTIARYGASKYAMLLCCDHADRGKDVMERVRHAFYEAHAGASIRFNYRIVVMKELEKRGAKE